MPVDIYTKGKLIDYGTSKNGQGNLQVFGQFQVELNNKNDTPLEGPNSNVKNLIWYGHLSTEKGREVTVKALLVLGFQGEDLSEISKGPEGGALDMGRLVDMNVGEEADQSNPPVMRMRLKFINAPGGGVGNVERLDVSETKKLLGDLNMKAMLTSVRKENPNLVEVSKGGEKKEVF